MGCPIICTCSVMAGFCNVASGILGLRGTLIIKIGLAQGFQPGHHCRSGLIILCCHPVHCRGLSSICDSLHTVRTMGLMYVTCVPCGAPRRPRVWGTPGEDSGSWRNASLNNNRFSELFMCLLVWLASRCTWSMSQLIWPLTLSQRTACKKENTWILLLLL